MLLRCLKRRASAEAETPEEFIDAELIDRNGRYDLHLSVYQLDENHSTRVLCEHQAGSDLDPKPHCLIDLREAVTTIVLETPGETGFQYTQTRHREVTLESDEDAIAFGKRIFELLSGIGYKVSLADMRSYLALCVNESDPEWLAFFSGSPKGPKWRSLAKTG